jgi:hypothetical protein
MENKLLDLRFVIGAFFTIVGIMLVAFGFMSTSVAEDMQSINRWAGSVFALFGVVMIVLSLVKNAADELE